MSRRAILLLAVALWLASCTGSSPPTPDGAAPTGGHAARAWPPPPDAPIPTDADVLASTLLRADADLVRALPGWAGGPPAAPPPMNVVLLALYEQRVYGTLADRPAAALRVAAMLPV